MNPVALYICVFTWDIKKSNQIVRKRLTSYQAFPPLAVNRPHANHIEKQGSMRVNGNDTSIIF